MNKMIIVLLFLIVSSCSLLGGKENIIEKKQIYKAIFSNGNYFVTELSNNYRIKKLQKIDSWLDRNLPYTKEKYAERIVSLLMYDQIIIKISMYFTINPNGSNNRGYAYDIFFSDNIGYTKKINLCISEKWVTLAFAKIINKTLFIGLNDMAEISYPMSKVDFTNLYSIKLDQEDYTVTKFNHNLGEIEDIWIQNDGKMLYTTNNDNKLESGILNILEKNVLELIEVYDYSIIEYDNTYNQMIGFDINNQLFYRNSGQNIHKITNVQGIVFKSYIIESDSIIISSYIEKDDIIGYFLFGGTLGRMDKYKVYSYYSLKKINNVISVKKINSINKHWFLVQIIRQ